MDNDVARSVLVLAIALRVFTPDVRSLLRWLLGTGVRVGVACLNERQQACPTPVAVHTRVPSPDEGGHE
jgi:hypothetical protein